MENLNPRLRHAFAFLAITVTSLSLVQFLLYYIPFGFYYDNTPLLFLSYYVTNFLEALFPPLAATVIFLVRPAGIKNKIIPCILISLSRLIYSIPYYYIYYVSDVFNSAESLLLASLVSLIFLLFFFLQTFVCVLIINGVERRASKVFEERQRSKIFNVDDHINFGIILSVLLVFVIFFAREAISTVQYLIENKGTYRTDEILSIVGAYLVLFLFAFLNYVLVSFIKNALLKQPEKKDLTEEIKDTEE